ncbi:MAG: Lrp/AsnC family transcriptional regulator [Candidatus Woesearchaeota archaeon]
MVKINRDLLYLIAENSRAKIRDLAQLQKGSPQRIKYSLKTLLREGIIYNPYCVFDYSYFGLILFKVYFKGGYISEHDKIEIIKKLSDNNYVVAMYELNGEFDLCIDIESPNPSRFNKELRKVCSLIPSLNNFKMILNLVTHIYPRAYLLKNSNLVSNSEQEIIIGGDREMEVFTENEMRVMKNLLDNPQLRLSHLAKLSGINIKTAATVLKMLRKRKVIKGFKYLIDTNKLGLYKFRLFLNLHNISQERENQMLNYLLRVKEIVQVNKTIGDWSMEVDIESTDKTRVKHVISQLREEFKDLIEYFNIIEFYQYYERTYLPRYMFQQFEEALLPAPKIEVVQEEEK